MPKEVRKRPHISVRFGTSDRNRYPPSMAMEGTSAPRSEPRLAPKVCTAKEYSHNPTIDVTMPWVTPWKSHVEAV